MLYEVITPGRVVVTVVGWAFLAVGDHRQTAGVDPLCGQVVHCGTGTFFAEGKVVLNGTSLVTMSLDLDDRVREFVEQTDVVVERGASIRAEIELVKIKVVV